MIRRYLAEFVGTFVIVFAPVAFLGASQLNGGHASLNDAAWVSGLAVLAMIYSLGHISAAHFNPAVTLGFAVARRFPWRYVLPYWISQLAASIAAASVALAIFGHPYGAELPSVATPRALAVEASITFLLMLVIISVATDRRVNDAVPGLAIGLTVVLGVFIGGPMTGAAMNPARSLGPALFHGGVAISSYWIYVVGPAVGAMVAARLYESLRGGEMHAKNAPNDLASALEEIASTTR